MPATRLAAGVPIRDDAPCGVGDVVADGVGDVVADGVGDVVADGVGDVVEPAPVDEPDEPAIQSLGVHAETGSLRQISITYSGKFTRRWTGVTPLVK